MQPRVLCPFHKEETPSCVLYETGYHCYGCGAHGPLTDISNIDGISIPKVVRDDISSTIKYIKSLPTDTIRGLRLHFDDQYYYLLWPDNNYYTKRSRTTISNGSKYVCPKGHARPLFIAREGDRGLLIVEGELNAMSAALVDTGWTVCSPGGASSFTERHIEYYMRFDNIKIAVDNDVAGVTAILKLKPLLEAHSLVQYYLLDDDFNDILQKYGKDQLRQTLEKTLEM